MSAEFRPLRFTQPSGYGNFETTERYTETAVGDRTELIGRPYYRPVSLFICPLCSAVVENTTQHRVWHEVNNQLHREGDEQ